ncbi:MAG: insulinase family protein [Candidatus Aminicenantes bacterium]
MIKKMASIEFNLANGIRCIAIKKAKRFLVTSKIFVKAGSRQDETLPGLAHMVEHLLFRVDSADYYRNIHQSEGLDGKIKAITTREYTEYSLAIIKTVGSGKLCARLSWRVPKVLGQIKKNLNAW